METGTSCIVIVPMADGTSRWVPASLAKGSRNAYIPAFNQHKIIENGLDVQKFNEENIEMVLAQQFDPNMLQKITKSIDDLKPIAPIHGQPASSASGAAVAAKQEPDKENAHRAAMEGGRSMIPKADKGASSAGATATGLRSVALENATASAPVAVPLAIPTPPAPVDVEGAPAVALAPAPEPMIIEQPPAEGGPAEVPAPISPADIVPPPALAQALPGVPAVQAPVPAPLAPLQDVPAVAPAVIPAPLPAAVAPVQVPAAPAPVAPTPTRVQPKRPSTGGESSEAKKMRANLAKMINSLDLPQDEEDIAIFRSEYEVDRIANTLLRKDYGWTYQYPEPELGYTEDTFLRPGLPKSLKNVKKSGYKEENMELFSGREAVNAFVKGLFAAGKSSDEVLVELKRGCAH